MQFMQNVLRPVFVWIKNHTLLFFLIALVGLGLAIFAYQKATQPAPKATLANPVRKDLQKTLAITGIIEAKEKARLRFLSSGNVVYVGAKEGEAVKKGQTIAAIDQRALKKQLDQDLNQFMQQRLSWDQTNVDIFNDSLYTTNEERTRKSAELDLINRALNVEIRTVAIENTKLTAPFDGILTISPTLVTGVQLTASDFFEIVNPDSLIFKAAVDEIDLAGLKEGLQATLELDAYSNQQFTTTLSYISYTAMDTATKTVFFVEFPIDTKKYEQNLFRIGMNGEAKITLETRQNVLTIPLRATRERQGRTLVNVAINGNPATVEEREIMVGLETSDEIEVISGLSEQDYIVIP
jgi:RND family efflux transporter MFP subunit